MNLASAAMTQTAACCYALLLAVQLVDLFGSVRDDWIKQDLHGWLDANDIYPGIAEDLAIAHERDELYIVTTKQVTAPWLCCCHNLRSVMSKFAQQSFTPRSRDAKELRNVYSILA